MPERLDRERRILLLGAEGQVGWELARALPPIGRVTATTRADADLRDPAALRAIVDAVRPHAVVLAAAYTDVDGAEADAATAYAANAEAPGVLADACRRRDALLVHFSTDYVFDGGASRPYREADPTAPLGVYGASKLAGERAIADAGCRALVFRTSWVYADRGRNFLRTVLRLARERAELRIVADQIGAPTSAAMVAQAVTSVLARAIDADGFAVDADLLGVHHLTAAGQTSWHGFAAAILEEWPDPERRATRVTAIETADFPTPARRPAYSVLDGARVAGAFGIRLPHWRDQLRLLARTAPAANTLPRPVP